MHKHTIQLNLMEQTVFTETTWITSKHVRTKPYWTTWSKFKIFTNCLWTQRTNGKQLLTN